MFKNRVIFDWGKTGATACLQPKGVPKRNHPPLEPFWGVHWHGWSFCLAKGHLIHHLRADQHHVEDVPAPFRAAEEGPAVDAEPQKQLNQEDHGEDHLALEP